MKLKTIILALTYGLIVLIFFPYLFIQINNYLSLPIYDNIVLKIPGFLLIYLGGIFALHSYFLFWNLGRGTPVPIEPPKKLVIKGLYKYTRNPIYVGFLIIYIGIFFHFGHLLLVLYALIAWIGYNFYVAKFEEPILKRRFGTEYESYQKKVRRWI